MKIALGPIPYYWPRAAVTAFYAGIEASAVDVVYLGETICSRRHELRLPDWLALARRLAAAGKEVVLSTLALVESESDLRMMRRIAGNGEFGIEANDMGAVRMIAGTAPFVAGSHLNVYNPQTLALLAAAGARRWVAPVAISRAALVGLLGSRPPNLETEVHAYGRLPLALSARCFTARRYNLQKDGCQFRCLDHPEGLVLRTRDGEPFLVLNGIQTQSAHVCNLLGELPSLATAGVDVVRIGPRPAHTAGIAAIFRRVLDEPAGAVAGAAEIERLTGDGSCNGFWHGRPGMERAGAWA